MRHSLEVDPTGAVAAPALSVIVCTRNRAALLRDCLDHLLRQDPPPGGYEVVVVDDGSTDETASVAQAKEKQGRAGSVRYVRQDHGGVNAARNAGLGAAHGDVLLFHDDDELAPPGYLAGVAAFLRAAPELDGIGGPYRDYGGARLRLCSECSWEGGRIRQRKDGTVGRLLGGNMALRRRAFDQVGPFDGTISGAGDEVEWFVRAENQLRFGFSEDLWVWHRRDWAGLGAVARQALSQGSALPAYHRSLGTAYKIAPSKMLSYLGHAVARRCTLGLIRFLREVGAIGALLRGGALPGGREEPPKGAAPPGARSS